MDLEVFSYKLTFLLQGISTERSISSGLTIVFLYPVKNLSSIVTVLLPSVEQGEINDR